MAKRKKKTSKKKQRKGNTFQSAVNLLVGTCLIVCMVSVGYGFFARRAGARAIEQPLRIEILNGTGQAGLAIRVAAGLRRSGVDVFKVENADHFGYAETILIKRRAHADAETLARDLGCDNVVEQLREDGFVDATLIIGTDYGQLRLGLEPDASLPE